MLPPQVGPVSGLLDAWWGPLSGVVPYALPHASGIQRPTVHSAGERVPNRSAGAGAVWVVINRANCSMSQLGLGGGGRENVAALFSTRGENVVTGGARRGSDPAREPSATTAVAKACTSWEGSCTRSRARPTVFAAIPLSMRPNLSARQDWLISG